VRLDGVKSFPRTKKKEKKSILLDDGKALFGESVSLLVRHEPTPRGLCFFVSVQWPRRSRKNSCFYLIFFKASLIFVKILFDFLYRTVPRKGEGLHFCCIFDYELIFLMVVILRLHVASCFFYTVGLFVVTQRKKEKNTMQDELIFWMENSVSRRVLVFCFFFPRSS